MEVHALGPRVPVRTKEEGHGANKRDDGGRVVGERPAGRPRRAVTLIHRTLFVEAGQVSDLLFVDGLVQVAMEETDPVDARVNGASAGAGPLRVVGDSSAGRVPKGLGEGRVEALEEEGRGVGHPSGEGGPQPKIRQRKKALGPSRGWRVVLRGMGDRGTGLGGNGRNQRGGPRTGRRSGR